MAEPVASTELLTYASILTAAGATTAVWAVGNALRVAFKLDAPWIPLLLAVLLSYAIASRANQLNDALGWLLALVNACLIFLAASGVQQTATAQHTSNEGIRPHA